jgi:UDP-4-amino-4,6-dideoxy-N-acetyl-beta-L-altrosamine transaminase
MLKPNENLLLDWKSTMDTIPYGRQDISEEDIDSVVAVMRSDFLTQGPTVPAFEKSIASYCDANYAVATNSATSALHVACLALGVGVGDAVWTVANTFVASANCALYCGATVDFVDIDPRTYNMSVECLAEKLALSEISGKLPKVVIPVHFCGQPCDMSGIYALSQKYGFKIIEDASHAIGAKYKGGVVGGCAYSDISIFSFHPVKIITTGEGGMALTNEEDLAKRMRLFRSHGISNTQEDMYPRPKEEIWNYQQIELGFNYRITDLQAALGLCQLNRLDHFVKKRRLVALRYDDQLSNLPIQLPWQHPDGNSSFHLYPIRVRLSEAGKTQKELYEALQISGIGVNLHYIPVYRQPFYEKIGFKAGYCPETEKYFKEAISIPLYFGLSDQQQERVIKAIGKALII